LDLEVYDKILLGGDLMMNTSKDSASIEIANQIFDLSSENTLLSVGLHDTYNQELLQAYTQRKNSYVHTDSDITYLIVDTNVQWDAGEQMELINSVVDTVKSSNLIILTHHLVWMYDHDELTTMADSVSNAPIGDCDYCIRENSFHAKLYPKLVNLEMNGTEVWCIAGDIGFKVPQFEYETKEGITFLASGMGHSKLVKKAIIITRENSNAELSYEFKDLSALPQK